MVGILILQLITTVDARKIITSLFDGLGTLMVLNVIGHALGLESPYRKNWGDKPHGRAHSLPAVKFSELSAQCRRGVLLLLHISFARRNWE